MINENNSLNKDINRITCIDFLKGIGIISVVYGHCTSDVFSKIIYMFHMPLFFFITGFLSSIRYDRKEFFIEKSKQLFIPYFSFLIIIYFLQELVYYSTHVLSTKNLLKSLAKFLLGGRLLSGYTSVFWFIPCLFLTQQFVNYLISKYSIKYTIIVLTISFLLSFFNELLFPSFYVPYNINTVLASSPFYFLGFLVKSSKINPSILLITIISVLGIGLTVAGYPNFYDMKNVKYGMFIITFSSSISLILTMFYIVKRLPNISILNNIGKASLIIMYLHQPVQILINNHVTNNIFIRILIAVLFSLVINSLLQKRPFTKAIFLGNKKDLIRLGI